MKEIEVEVYAENTIGNYSIVPVIVDWFPPLEEWQMIENANALYDGEPTPHPNPNLITVKVLFR